MSPEIGVSIDEHERADLTCTPLPWESPKEKDYIKIATNISAAGFNMLRHVKKHGGVGAQSYLDKAMTILTRYMPEDAAAEIANAYIKRDTGTKAVVILDSQGHFFTGIVGK